MILTLIDVVLPVFLVMAAGHAATRFGFFKDTAVDGLMIFTQNFAIPCMLFRAVTQLDLGAAMDPGMLTAFYAGATVSFTLGVLGARYLFHRRPGEAVAIGFGGFFSNSVLLGLAITERAYGTAALAPNYAIIALHAPFCYAVGITVMEFARSDGQRLAATVPVVLRAMFRNPIMMAILAGVIANLTGLSLPAVATTALDLMTRAALPAAIFGLGGILVRYRIGDKLPQVAMICVLSLVVHPAITWTLATQVFAVSDAMLRSAVVTAAMAPGVNAYLFASMYGRATGVVSSAVLLATALSVLTASFWLWLLPPA